MQGFIKDNKLIINTMIQADERDILLDYINNAENKNINLVKLYDIKGNVSGVSFEIEEIEGGE